MPSRAQRSRRRSPSVTASAENAPSRRAARRRLSPEERRAQLIEVVEELFKTRPYDELGVPDVAREAGVTQGLVYHYFPTKEDLFLAAFRERADELLARCLPPLDAPMPVLAERGVRGYLDFVEDRRVVYLNLFRSATAAEPQVRRLCEETRWRIVDHFLAVLGADEGALPVTRLSLRAYVGYCEALVLEWLEQGAPPRSTIEKLLHSAIIGAIRGGLSCDAASPLDAPALDALERAYREHFDL